MLRLNDSIIWERISLELIKGNILKTNLFVKADNTPQFERIILLNNNFSQDNIYYVMATSKTEWYEKYWEKMQYCCVWLDEGTVDLFSLKTVVNCREVPKLTKLDLFNRYVEGKLKFLGILPKEILKRIIETLITSKLIDDDIMKEII